MPIKKIIYQSILLLWLFKPIQKIMKWGIAKSPFLKKKLYQDLRFKGILRVKIHGKPFLLINPGNTTIENEIYWNGLENGWEKNTIKLWSEFVINSKNILDIGTNSGLFSMISATLNPDAKIFAFEPVQRTSELLKTNVDINKLLG